MKKRDIVILSIAGAIAVAAGLYMALQKRGNRDEKNPPRNAPQLDIENPGEQSEFLSSPSEENELG